MTPQDVHDWEKEGWCVIRHKGGHVSFTRVDMLEFHKDVEVLVADLSLDEAVTLEQLANKAKAFGE